jgi:hypothetical protein
MAFGNGTASFLEGIGYIGRTSKIPYTNAVNNTYIFHNQTSYIFGGAYAGNCLDFLSRVAPNRKGYWGTNDIYVVEGQWENDQSGNATTGAHEGYGVLKNIKLSNVGTMAPYQDSRTVQGLDWLYIHLASSIFYGGSSAHAVCFLNTISVS